MTGLAAAAPTVLPGTRRDQQKALVVNIFGGPGLGKTTMAARIFAELKSADIEAANPEEYAKTAIWEGRPDLLDDQVLLAGRTWKTLHTLTRSVDVVVMDSPLLLGSVYAGDREALHFHQLVVDLHRRSDRMNILIERDPLSAYATRGRRENEAAARDIDDRIRLCLDAQGEEYFLTPAFRENAEAIAARITEFVRNRT